MKTHFKEGDINEGLIDKTFQLSTKNIVVLVRCLTLRYSGWAFSGLLTDGRSKKPPNPPSPPCKIFHKYPAMMKRGTVIPCLKEI